LHVVSVFSNTDARVCVDRYPIGDTPWSIGKGSCAIMESVQIEKG